MNATFLLAWAFFQVTPPPLPAPPTLPPTLAFARVEAGAIHLTKFVVVPEKRRVLLTKTTPDGKTIEEPTQVMEPVVYIEKKQIPLTEARATDLMGKPIPPETITERLKSETAVVLIPGATLEARYRKAFRDDLVFLTVPPERRVLK